MSREQTRKEAEALSRPGSTVRCVDVGETVVVLLEPYSVPVDGVYSPSKLEALAFIVPTIYPDAQPDPSGFYVKPATLKVGTPGAAPQSSNPDADLLGEKWLKFSWGLKGVPWDTKVDNLETHLANIEGRFQKKN